MKDKTEIKIGSIVTFSRTDLDNTPTKFVGKLTDRNRRYVAVCVDGRSMKVGKTKISLYVAPKEITPFQKAANHPKQANAKIKSDYIVCRAASGRKSLDNDDAVARSLRGLKLELAYEIAAKALHIDEVKLRSQYSHLNSGQQRMCLGNRIRRISS